MKLRGKSQKARLGTVPRSNAQYLTEQQIERLPQYGPNCPLCHAVTVQRDSRYGSFWGCRMYPECKGKVSLQHY